MADANIPLNEDQRSAADALRAMLATDTAQMMLLRGYAGTGKTSTLMTVLGGRKDVLYLTPSQAARGVIIDALGAERRSAVHTLHSALGAKRHIDPRTGAQHFAPEASGDRMAKLLHNVNVVVLDECSMVGGGWFEALLDRLGLITKSGARFLVERSHTVPSCDIDDIDYFTALLYGHGVDPLDGEGGRRVVGRPQREDGEDGVLFRWMIEGGRKNVKLVVMGDPAQLPPVYGGPLPEGHTAWSMDVDRAWALSQGRTCVSGTAPSGEDILEITDTESPTFDASRYDYVMELRQLMRAGSEALAAANMAARRGVERLAPYRIQTQRESIELIGERELVSRAVRLYEDKADLVVLCWRNSTKNALAEAIRAQLLGETLSTEVLHPGEPAMFTAPYEPPAGGARRYNNGDLVYIEHSSSSYFECRTLPRLSTPYQVYRIRSARDGAVSVIYALSKPCQRQFDSKVSEVREDLCAQLDMYERGIRDAKTPEERAKFSAMTQEVLGMLGELVDVSDRFACIESSYTRTCHKAQGGSWGHVIYHQSDVFVRRDRLECAKLAYVAISRARHHLTVVR